MKHVKSSRRMAYEISFDSLHKGLYWVKLDEFLSDAPELFIP